MKIVLGLFIAIFLTACGGNSAPSSEDPPASPQTTERENIPPSVPKI